MYKLNTSFKCQAKEKILVESFRNITGIDCKVIYLDKNHTFDSYVLERVDCCFFRLNVSLECGLENIIRVMDSIAKPYVFFCPGMLMFCAAEAVAADNNRIIFIGGPINTGSADILIKEKQNILMMGKISEEMRNCSRNYPCISFTNAQYATQLLYNIVKYNYPGNKEQMQPDSENILCCFKPESDINSNEEFAEQIFDAVDDKKRIVKTIAYVNTTIDEILKYIASEDYLLAKDCFEKLMTQPFYKETGMTAKGHIVGSFCELWQHIVASHDFAITKEIFLVYSSFLDDISKIQDNSSLYSTTMHYFNNIYIELIKTYKGNDLDSIAGKTKEYIKKNCLMDISVNTIANDLNFDVSYLCRAFKAETGTTIKHYINTCRILQAAEIIQNEKKSLADVAREVGFNDFQLFQQYFKNHFGVNPSEYRIFFR